MSDISNTEQDTRDRVYANVDGEVKEVGFANAADENGARSLEIHEQYKQEGVTLVDVEIRAFAEPDWNAPVNADPAPVELAPDETTFELPLTRKENRS